MTRDKNRFEDYPSLREIKLPPHEREEIWRSIEHGMEHTRTHKTKRGFTMIKTSAAVVATLALFGGGVAYEVHHAPLNSSQGVTSTSHQKGSTTPSKTPLSQTSSYFSDASQIGLIKARGYTVDEKAPNATVRTASGDTLKAWIATQTQSQDGYSQLVFFFLNGTYLGTDTAKPSLAITSAKAAGHGIAVTYPVYMKNDSFAMPTGTPVTITYTWTGSKLVPNKPYPKQFQASNKASQGSNAITSTSYASPAQAASQIGQIASAFTLGGQKTNLGHGIIAYATGAMGSARYEWREGNWEVEVRFYTVNRGVKQVAQDMVSYLHTHYLPAPNNHGAIVVQSTAAKPSGYGWGNTIAWQEGSKVFQLKQNGNPVNALANVVNHGSATSSTSSTLATSTNSSQQSFHQTFKVAGMSSENFITPKLGFRVTNLGGGVNNFQYAFSRTTDGGKTWTRMSTGHYSHVEGVSFIDAKTGYLLNNSPAYAITPDLFVTHDGGTSWKEQKLPIPNAYKNGYRNSSYPIFFTPAVGFIPVYGQATPTANSTTFLYMLVTTDGGQSWTAYTGHQGNGLAWNLKGQTLTVTHGTSAITVAGLMSGAWTVRAGK